MGWPTLHTQTMVIANILSENEHMRYRGVSERERLVGLRVGEECGGVGLHEPCAHTTRNKTISKLAAFVVLGLTYHGMCMFASTRS